MTNESGANRLSTGDRHLIAVIGDQDTVTGMLLAGIGNVDSHQKRNFHIVDAKTSNESIEEAFKDFTSRRDVAIILINQHVANRIRHLLESYNELLPTILEIPSKDHPWDPEKDSVLRKVNRIFASD